MKFRRFTTIISRYPRTFRAVLWGSVGAFLAGAFEYWATDGVSGLIPLGSGLISAIVGSLGTTANRGSHLSDPTVDEPQILDGPQSISEPRENDSVLVYSPRTPLELVNEMDGLTEFSVKQKLERHLGQILKVDGTVSDVRPGYGRDSEVVVDIRTEDGDIPVHLEFDGQSKTVWAGSLNFGDMIEASGRISYIGSMSIRLENCEEFPAILKTLEPTSTDEPQSISGPQDNGSSLMYSPRTPLELVSEMGGLTELAIEQRLERHIGQILNASGTVSEVRPEYGSKVSVRIISGDDEIPIYFEFCSQSRISWAGSLNIGDIIESSGQISRISQHSITLKNCDSFPAKLKNIGPTKTSEMMIAPVQSECTAVEINDEVKGKTDIVTNQIMEKYKGKSLQITGIITSVSEPNTMKGTALVYVRLLKKNVDVCLQFTSPTKFAWASSLIIGDTIRASGIVERHFLRTLHLINCEDFLAERIDPNAKM